VTADPLGVRAAAAAIMETAIDVRVGDIAGVAGELVGRPVPGWDRRRHYDGPHLLEYVLVVDTVNFSFWGGSAGGYSQLAERVRDAFNAGEPLWEPARLRSLDTRDLERLIGPFPMLEERAAALRELGSVEDLTTLVAPTAAETAQRLAASLGSYDDVPFYKRAQLVPADLAAAGVREFSDLAALTALADYKLPQVLRHAGAIVYSDRLASLVDDWVELAPGSPPEREIRAATVVAVDRIRDALAKRGRELMAVEVDRMLWSWSQSLFPVRPYHRTRTIFY
jgi:hypothetical protein